MQSHPEKCDPTGSHEQPSANKEETPEINTSRRVKRVKWTLKTEESEENNGGNEIESSMKFLTEEEPSVRKLHRLSYPPSFFSMDFANLSALETLENPALSNFQNQTNM